MPRSRSAFIPLTVVLIAALAGVNLGCGDDPPVDPGNGPRDTVATADTIPPAAPEDFIARLPGAGSIALQWIAPGDDGMSGTAAAYDIRYSKATIDDDNWDDADSFAEPPDPKPGGEIQTFRVHGLDANTHYFLAIKARDEAGNESDLSRNAEGTTGQEYNSPGPVTDLAAIAVDSLTFLLTWTAPGDDAAAGTATAYDIRYHKYHGVNESNWNSAVQADNETAPKPIGSPESLLVHVTERDGNHGFGLKAVDEAGNWSDVSNVCLGLGAGDNLWTFPPNVSAGGLLTLIYRVPEEATLTQMELHSWSYNGCGTGDYQLIHGDRDPGVYRMTYDFYNDVTQDYLPTATYHISLCFDGVENELGRVEFAR
jgi:hypothetical protein